MAERYNVSDFKKLEGNKVIIDSETDYASIDNNSKIDLDSII